MKNLIIEFSYKRNLDRYQFEKAIIKTESDLKSLSEVKAIIREYFNEWTGVVYVKIHRVYESFKNYWLETISEKLELLEIKIICGKAKFKKPTREIELEKEKKWLIRRVRWSMEYLRENEGKYDGYRGFNAFSMYLNNKFKVNLVANSWACDIAREIFKNPN